MKNNNGSDFGFLAFLLFAIVLLMPLFFNVSSFEQYLFIGKIVLIVALVLVVIAISVFGTLYYKRKVKIRAIKKAEERKAAYEEIIVENERQEQKIVLKENQVRIAQREKPLKKPFVNAESNSKKTGLESLNEFEL
ncbi:MAG: hypothetical protein ACTSPK_02515 [Candidatus Heimdallarchaeota archaeon]